MKKLTEIRLDDRCYDSMLFSMDSDYVSTFNENEDADDTFVPAESVLLIFDNEEIKASDFIRSLTDEDLSQIQSILEDDELTYLVSTKGEISMGQLLEIRWNEGNKVFGSLLFYKDSDDVVLCNFGDLSEDIVTTADKVSLKFEQAQMNAGDFIKSLTDEDISQLPCYFMLGDETYLVNIGNEYK